MSFESPKAEWGASYRLVAAEKWKAKSAAMGRNVTESLVEYARPVAGMNVLDLASGTGEPAITLAGRVGPRGHVTALDLSAELLAIADQRAKARKLANFSIQQADAHHLPFESDAFDLATSRFGVMFFADCDQALREVHRVLKAGARACFTAWGPFDQPYWSSIGIVHKHVGGPLLAPGTANMFAFAEPQALSDCLCKAGFGEVEQKSVTVPWTWPGTPEEVWEYIQSASTPFQPLLKNVPEQAWEPIRREVLSAIHNYYDGERVAFGATVVLASGKK